MTTKVVFETAALASVVANASRIAPTKGKEVETYAGFYIEVRPDGSGEREVNIRAANGDVFYTEYLDALEIDGPDVDWRVPSLSMGGFLRNLPIGTGKSVTLEQVGGQLIVTQGRAKCEFPLIASDYYPDWDMFDPSQTTPVRNFGDRISQVSWAADRGDLPPMNGVYIDGQRLIATNKYRIAKVPCEVELGQSDPVTVPVGILGPILSQMVDIRVGVIGNFLCIAPNDYTQIKCVLFQDQYPNVDSALNAQHDSAVLLNRDVVTDMVNRVLSVGNADRQVALRVTIGNGEIEFFVQGETKAERTMDAMDLPAQADHEPVAIYFSPENFSDAVSKAPDRDVMLWYNKERAKSAVKFDGGSGYEVVVQPRRPQAVQAMSGD